MGGECQHTEWGRLYDFYAGESDLIWKLENCFKGVFFCLFCFVLFFIATNLYEGQQNN